MCKKKKSKAIDAYFTEKIRHQEKHGELMIKLLHRYLDNISRAAERDGGIAMKNLKEEILSEVERILEMSEGLK